jgi:hypothetical protein
MAFCINRFKKACAESTAENISYLSCAITELRELIKRRDKWGFNIRKGQHFFRARNSLDSNGNPLSVQEMGAPPSDIARAGRFNEDRNSVLYAATTRVIALAEVRPARGEVCSLALIETLDNIFGANLLPTLKSFKLSESASQTDDFVWEGICEHLAHQPTQSDRDLHYRSCRLIASVFAEMGAKFLLYRTSFYSKLWGDYSENDTAVGVANIVFFDPSLAEVLETKRYELNWPMPAAELSEPYIRKRDS